MVVPRNRRTPVSLLDSEYGRHNPGSFDYVPQTIHSAQDDDVYARLADPDIHPNSKLRISPRELQVGVNAAALQIHQVPLRVKRAALLQVDHVVACRRRCRDDFRVSVAVRTR
jgi:hypothetical protein